MAKARRSSQLSSALFRGPLYGLYLPGSLLSFAQNVGIDTDVGDSLAGKLSFIGLLALLYTLAGVSRLLNKDDSADKQPIVITWILKHKQKLIDFAEIFRAGTSGVKNAVNVFNYIKSIVVKLGGVGLKLSKSVFLVSAIAIPVGVVHALGNIAKFFYDKKRDKLLKRLKNFDRGALNIIDHPDCKPPSKLAKGLCMGWAVVDGMLDGVYIASVIVFLTLLVHLSVFSFGIPLIVLGAVITGLSIIHKISKEYQKQQDLEKVFCEATGTAYTKKSTVISKYANVSQNIRALLMAAKNAAKTVLSIAGLVLKKTSDALLSLFTVVVVASVLAAVAAISYIGLKIHNYFTHRPVENNDVSESLTNEVIQESHPEDLVIPRSAPINIENCEHSVSYQSPSSSNNAFASSSSFFSPPKAIKNITSPPSPVYRTLSPRFSSE